MTPPTVAFVIDTLAVGGTERSLIEIVSRLKRVKPVVCTLFRGSVLTGELRQRGVSVVELDLPVKHALRAVFPLEAVLHWLRPTVVHAMLFRAELATRLAMKHSSVPLVNAFVNDSYGVQRLQALGPRGLVALARVLAADRGTAGRVDVFVANAHGIGETNARALAIDPNRVEVIYRGRDVEHFAAARTEGHRRQLRKALGISAGSRVIVNVARLLERKGQSFLMDAFAEIQSCDAHLVFVGAGGTRLQLEAQRARLGLQHRVHFLGERGDVAAVLGGADVFAFPSLFEGFPGALVEAMASGLPVVASDIDVHREAVSDGVSGRLVALHDTLGWAKCLGQLVDDEALCASLGGAGQTVARSRFAIDGVVDQHERLYQRLGSEGRQ